MLSQLSRPALMVTAVAAWLLLPAPCSAQISWPGADISTIETENLRVHVPRVHAEALRGLAARAEVIYAHLITDAGYQPDDKLDVLVSDWVDRHNGFSFVVPFPLVQVELAPALTESTIFAGYGHVERTLVHEFAHHISNDRTHGFRRGVEKIFGRVLPNDVLSLLVFYLSTPAHQTMPRFWHEGLATWAETHYADPASPWAGRGRDALVHMVWRLDAHAGGIPEVGDWRLTHHHWPFGNRVYLYGVAYMRHLQARFGSRLSLWELIREQSHSWPFFFNRGPRKMLGVRHRPLIESARDSLEIEQRAQIEALSRQPFTKHERLTPRDIFVGAPAWQGRDLVFSTIDPWGRPRVQRLTGGGEITATGRSSHALSAIRSDAFGSVVDVEYDWRRYGHVRVNGHSLGRRFFQPDYVALRIDSSPASSSLHPASNGFLVAVHLLGGGRQELVLAYVRDGELADPLVLPTEGIPWSPAFRPTTQGAELAWVETDADGSRLVLRDVETNGERRVLHTSRGRILHPVWSADGSELFFCSDETGVANAYRLRVSENGVSVAEPVTHTLGGVMACVPSPDGQSLAIVDHDADGPFIAIIPNDPASAPESLPTIELAWPALDIVDARDALDADRIVVDDVRRRRKYDALTLPQPIPDGNDVPVEPTESYWGLREVRPRFWTPTTAVVPSGGTGVLGFASDPLFTHVVTAGIGVGPWENELVAHASYTNLANELQWGLAYQRSERTYFDEIRAVAGEEFDYTETIDQGEFRIGRGIVALERRFRAYAAVGVAERNVVDESEREFRGFNLVNVPAFDGTEQYVEFTIGYGDTTFYPTSYSTEDGFEGVARYRHSGFGGDLDRNLAFADATYTVSVWPEGGHQLVVGGQVGWSDGDRILQGSFSIGGSFQTSIPRGYFGDTEAIGDHLLAYTAAYRAPVWRPFDGYGTTPFRHRQIVLEAFFDAAKVSRHAPGDDGRWFLSVGGQVVTSWEALGLLIQPGIGVAHQLDGDEHTRAYFVLGFSR
ncbi:MAG: hypothetical protein AAF488_00395 [Planctomycetota bacterium]